MESIYKREENGCIVLVMLEDIPTADMPLELLDWIQAHSYIRYTEDPDGERLFWDTLATAVQTL